MRATAFREDTAGSVVLGGIRQSPSPTGQGFDEAFPGLYQVAYRAAYKLLGDRTESEDVAQEAVARALDRWRKVEGYAVPWVSRVAANLAIDRARSHDRSRRGPAPVQEPGRADPDAIAHLDLVRALRTLPRRQRDAVVLRYLLDQPEEAVAALMEVSVGSVKTHASRGLRALRRELGEGEG
jgi:RNA polymerase sigma-70 factor (ECF subfamily)